MLRSDLGRFRLVGLVEGFSLLLLLFVAMPLKYAANLPEAVTIVGTLHGGLFVIYILFALFTTYRIRWSFVWLLSAVAAAFIPFGNLVLDWRLKRKFQSV